MSARTVIYGERIQSGEMFALNLLATDVTLSRWGAAIEGYTVYSLQVQVPIFIRNNSF